MLENYVLANGIKGYKWTKELYDKEEISEEENLLLEIMDEVRIPLMRLHNKIKGRKNVREIAISLYEFLVELDVFNTLDTWLEEFDKEGLQDKIKEYIQVPEIVMEILDQLVDVLGDEILEL